MLSSLELAALRADLEETLPDTATIERPVFTADGYGGQTLSYTKVGTAACRLTPTRVTEEMIASGLRAITAWRVILPADTDVQAEDRLTVDSRTLRVVGVYQRSEGACLVALAVEGSGA